MASSKLSFTGFEAVERRLQQEVADLRARAVAGVAAEAESIKHQVQPPVDTGALRDSGRVESTVEGNQITSAVVYGGDQAPYAPFVHEMPGDGHKFLERKLIEAEGGIANRLANRIKK